MQPGLHCGSRDRVTTSQESHSRIISAAEPPMADSLSFKWSRQAVRDSGRRREAKGGRHAPKKDRITIKQLMTVEAQQPQPKHRNCYRGRR